MYISSRIATSFDIRFLSIQKLMIHRSDNYTFLLVQKGGVTVKSDTLNCAISVGDLLLLEPGVSYTLQSLSQNQLFYFQCDKHFLDTHIPMGYHVEVNSSLEKKERFRSLCSILENIALRYQDETHPYAFISLIYQFLNDLLTFHLVPNKPLRDAEGDDHIQERVQKIKLYIDQHYHLPLFLQVLADELYLSPQYLSKFFKQHMGITFNKYLNNVRISHAYEELIYTDHSMTEIAYNNGFSNTSAFNKLFHDVYGESPTNVRKQYLDTSHTLSAKNSVENSAEIVPLPIAKHYVTPISYANHRDYYPSWRDTINIGPLSVALTVAFHEAFKRAQKDLKFKYVRFNNIFSEEIIRPLHTPGEYDFFNLDMIFDFFRDVHVIPFIEVCYRPPKISLSTGKPLSADTLFEPEHTLDHEIELLDALLRHYIFRYGYEAVSQWRFEIWHKRSEHFDISESPAAYWRKFQTFYDCIKSHLPECAVGGPGFNTANPAEDFKRLLEEMNRQKLSPDFFSICIYSYEPTLYQMADERTPAGKLRILSGNTDHCLHIVQSYKKLLLSYAPESAPLYITEFNSGLNGLNYVAASAFQAAFVFHNVASLFLETPCIAYWHFSDMRDDLQYDPQIFATGMGLLDRNGIPKSAFHTYGILAKLSGRLVTSGKNYIATTNGKNKYQVMMCHYVHYNNNYCFTYQNPLDIGHTYDVFEEIGNRAVRLELSDIPPGRYKCTNYNLNR